ncbi:hypothetical protein [Pseudomonas sp. URMO17WK12:I11]|uniref:hypothetical protein n=1 Tax=Pseudomonas sp. URMO17WK12:I11 TaxID=1283291 RepID=UPI002114CC33|nr:hypothetical protein [Pseudomonas sp. URMO17WK12:I11]
MRKPVIILLFAALFGCENPEMKNDRPTIKINFYESIQSLLSKSTAPLSKDCNSDICFFEFDISSASPNKAVLTVESRNQPMVFDDVISAALMTYKSDTLSNSYVTLNGVAPNSEHELAMNYFSELLDKLSKAGWQRYIYPNEARIPATESSKFKDVDEVLGTPVATGPWQDPTLGLDKNGWLSMPMFSNWLLYRDNEYLKLTVQRENDTQAPREKGSYLFTLTFRSEADFYKGFVDDEDRENWKALLPAELKRMAQERAQTEARLKKMGIAIDEDYQDPPIKALE